MEATFVRDISGPGWAGSVHLYRTSEPFAYPYDDGVRGTTDHFVTSAVDGFGGPATYVFATDEHGNVLDWLELDGSFRGGLDHERAKRGFVEAQSAKAAA